MKKQITGIIIFLMVLSSVCANDLYKDIKTVTNLSVGTKNNEIKLLPEPDLSGLEGRDNRGFDYFRDGPTSMCFDATGELYVFDQNNNKIYVYTQDFLYNKTIEISSIQKATFIPQQMEIYTDGFVFYYLDEMDTSVKKIDFDGNIVWSLVINNYNPYNIDWYVYYYNEENNLFFHYLEKRGILCFANLQNKQKEIITLSDANTINDYLKLRNITNMYINDENQVVKNEQLMKFDLETLVDFKPTYSTTYLGKDIKENMYFTARNNRFMVDNENGKFLINVCYDEDPSQTGRTAYPSLHPSGDVYWLEYSYAENKIELKRVKNVWDPVGRAKWYAQQGKVKSGTINDTDVTVRSEPNLEGAKLTHLQPNTKVTVLGQSAEKMQIGSMNNYWYHVELEDGTVGWVYGAFVDIE